MRWALLLTVLWVRAAAPQPFTARTLPLPPGTYRNVPPMISPERIEGDPPEYSNEGRLARLQGTVWLVGVVGIDGSVRDLRVTRGLGLGLDEKAVEAIRRWRFRPGTYQNRPVPVFTTIQADFLLPDQPSRWHLIRAQFDSGEGTSPPAILAAPYPADDGISADSVEEARILGAIGRPAYVRLNFRVNEYGAPGNYRVESASGDLWGREAIRLVHEWRFQPGRNYGVPVPVSCTVDLMWGKRKLTARDAARVASVFDSLSEKIPRKTMLIELSEESYSQPALDSRIEGTVTLSINLRTDGKATDIKVVKPVGLGLDEKAVEAVAGWDFGAIRVDGGPVMVIPMAVDVRFRLNGVRSSPRSSLR